MAKFRYRMQNILNVKEKLENQARNDFAVAVAKVNEEEEKLCQLNDRLAEYEAQLKILYADVLDVLKIKEAQDAIEVLKYHVQLQKVALSVANQQLDVARSKLTVAIQERKTHEKLKEKEFDEFRAEEAAKESKEIDELVSFRHTQD